MSRLGNEINHNFAALEDGSRELITYLLCDTFIIIKDYASFAHVSTPDDGYSIADEITHLEDTVCNLSVRVA